MSAGITRGAASILIAVSTALVIVGVSIAPFLNPIWVGFEQGRSHASEWTGYTPIQLKVATDGILADLVFGPPTFDVQVDGQPVLNERERSHMADVRGVFAGFAALVGIAIIVLLVAATASRRSARRTFWQSVRSGSGALAVGTVVAGAVGLVAFDSAFDVFHRLFFAGGTYTFDPRTDRLVQLFPDQFWLETSLAVGGVILVLSTVTWWFAARRRAVDERSRVGVGRVVEAQG